MSMEIRPAAPVQLLVNSAQELVEQQDLDGILDGILDRLDVTDAKSREHVRGALVLIINQVAASDEPGKLDALLGAICGAIEEKVCLQLDEFLHAPLFQEYESRWTSLSHLIGESTGDAVVSVLSASREEVCEDLLENKLEESALRSQLYKKGIGMEGETPIASVICGFDFGTDAPDVKLLTRASNLAADLHAPFIGNLSPRSMARGVENFDGLALLTASQLKDKFSEENKPEWMGLRNHPNSRYLGLTLPRVVGRLPYHKDTNPAGGSLKGYCETIRSRKDYLFLPASYHLGRQILLSFARTGLPQNVTGRTSGGLLEGLVAPEFEAIPGQSGSKFATEVLIDYEQEKALAVDLGLIPLIAKKASADAFFIGLPSLQRAKDFGNSEAGQEATKNFMRGTLLDNMLLVSRLSHCISAMQRVLAGAKLDGSYIKQQLDEWLKERKYPPQPMNPELAQRHPIKDYEVEVTPDPKRPGWYKIDVRITPIDSYQGADIALSFSGKSGQAQ